MRQSRATAPMSSTSRIAWARRRCGRGGEWIVELSLCGPMSTQENVVKRTTRQGQIAAPRRPSKKCPDMERPPSKAPGWTDRKLGGRVAAGNSPARVDRRLFRAIAASAQPPHMSMKLSISRTTSFLVYGRPYPPFREPTTEFSAQRSLTIAESTNSANSAANGERGSRRPSSVCTRAAKVMLETSQIPCAAWRSASRNAR